jgi:hypothetical protein
MLFLAVTYFASIAVYVNAIRVHVNRQSPMDDAIHFLDHQWNTAEARRKCINSGRNLRPELLDFVNVAPEPR